MITKEKYCPLLTRPRSLLKQERLDIAVKWDFFRFLYSGLDSEADRLYRWHIEKRTNGREPRSWKKNVEDYVKASNGLMESMLKTGYNVYYPIEYGANGRIRDGAHRLACALFLEIDVYYIIVPMDGTATWGEKWFINHKIELNDLMRIKNIWQWLSQS